MQHAAPDASLGNLQARGLRHLRPAAPAEPREQQQDYEREEDIEAAFETQEQNTQTTFDK